MTKNFSMQQSGDVPYWGSGGTAVKMAEEASIAGQESSERNGNNSSA
jgi:hypothetical protein